MFAVECSGAAYVGIDQIPLVERVVDEGRDRPDSIGRLKRELEVRGDVFIRNGLRREGQVGLLLAAIGCVGKERQIEVAQDENLLKRQIERDFGRIEKLGAGTFECLQARSLTAIPSVNGTLTAPWTPILSKLPYSA